ncbi:MAG: hypothetical protein WAW75_10185 [Gallionella sp.]
MKVKQGGCTRKVYAVRLPMLHIDRDAKQMTQAVQIPFQHGMGVAFRGGWNGQSTARINGWCASNVSPLHNYNQRLGYRFLMA